jgi:CysZ protein
MTLALTRAFLSLMHPRMLWLMVWPVLAALALWIVLAVLFLSQALHWIEIELGSIGAVQWMLTFAPLAFFAAHLAWVILVIAFIPLVLVTAVLLIGIFAMPAMVDHVSDRSYPALVRCRGGSFAGSLWNSAIALAVFAALAVVTLPLWVIPLLWPVIPVLLLAYFNQRVFRYDALAEHASATELVEVIRRHRGELFLLGAIISIMGHVPVVGFFVPVYGALAFVHYCLDRLQAMRSEPIEGEAIEV